MRCFARYQCVQYTVWWSIDEYHGYSGRDGIKQVCPSRIRDCLSGCAQIQATCISRDLIETVAKVVHTSTHTAGVHVVAKRLNRSEWVTEEICSGFFFMVAIDSQMRPIPIPQLKPQTDEEKRMWNLAQAAR